MTMDELRPEITKTERPYTIDKRNNYARVKTQRQFLHGQLTNGNVGTAAWIRQAAVETGN